MREEPNQLEARGNASPYRGVTTRASSSRQIDSVKRAPRRQLSDALPEDSHPRV